MLNKTEIDKLRTLSFAITGGSGFIGSNIVKMLVDLGVKDIRVLDDLSTSSIETIKTYIDDKRISFIQDDIRNKEACMQFCKGVDVVLHQAALGSVQRSMTDPAATNTVNVDGFLNMLIASKQNGIQKFIYASSSSVYGDDTSMPKKEALIGSPLSPYAVSKITGEAYARVFQRNFGLQTLGLRYFNVFGPHQMINGPYAAVIPLFMQGMLAHEQVTIFGDGSNTRDFTYVENVVQANLKAALCDWDKSEVPVLNIAYGATTSLNSLFAMLSEISGNTLQPHYDTPRKGDIRDSYADVSRAKRLIGYEPTVELHEGLRRTFEWFREQRSQKRNTN